jgi:hypothetical protein
MALLVTMQIKQAHIMCLKFQWLVGWLVECVGDWLLFLFLGTGIYENTFKNCLKWNYMKQNTKITKD